MVLVNCFACVLVISILFWSCDSSYSAIFHRNLTLKQWCDSAPWLKVVRRIINQPNDLFLTRENALQITHRWDSTFIDECVFTVEAEHGLVMNVNHMFFRPELRDPLNECIDYFRLKYKNGTKTHRMCGLVNATTASSNTMAVRSFVVPDGKVEVKIRIDDFRKLRPGREFLYLDFLFTQYDGCSQPNSFQCSEELCIHQKYVNDGNINCPYPGCSDETSCQNKTVLVPQLGSKRAIIGGIAAAVVLAVLVPITICCCCEFCRKGAVSRGHRNRNGMSGSGPTGGSEESRAAGGGRRQRHRTNRSASRGRHGDHLRSEDGAARSHNVEFTAVVTSSSAPPHEEQKESPPPTYESLFPGR